MSIFFFSESNTNYVTTMLITCLYLEVENALNYSINPGPNKNPLNKLSYKMAYQR